MHWFTISKVKDLSNVCIQIYVCKIRRPSVTFLHEASLTYRHSTENKGRKPMCFLENASTTCN